MDISAIPIIYQPKPSYTLEGALGFSSGTEPPQDKAWRWDKKSGLPITFELSRAWIRCLSTPGMCSARRRWIPANLSMKSAGASTTQSKSIVIRIGKKPCVQAVRLYLLICSLAHSGHYERCATHVALHVIAVLTDLVAPTYAPPKNAVVVCKDYKVVKKKMCAETLEMQCVHAPPLFSCSIGPL